MKLLNHTLSYLWLILLVVIGLWAGIFYINMIDEIHDSIDDGLDNSKQLIIRKALVDSQMLTKQFFHERNYKVREVSAAHAYRYRDVYLDSTLFMENEQDFEPVRILRTVFKAGNGRYYELEIVSSMVEEDDLIEDMVYALLWLYLALMASILLVNNFLLRKVWRPFYQLLDRLSGFRLGTNDDFKPPPTKVYEFKELNKSVEALINHTKEAYVSQTQFIGNAAHELQTPLAISISRLELLAEQVSDNEAQLQETAAVIESLQRMTRLNKDLLLLAKIESGQFPEEEPVNINTLAEHTVRLFEPMATYRKTRITIEQQAPLHVKMNLSLAEILITNLVKNAVTHSADGSDITVTVTHYGIRVKNPAQKGMLDKDRIFNRFYKDASAKSNTGLGLAITRSIADHYRFTITYLYEDAHIFDLRMK